LKEKVEAPVWKSENMAVGNCCVDHATLSISKEVGNNFADKRRSVSIAESLNKATEFIPF
jgi:hypothetical protein